AVLVVDNGRLSVREIAVNMGQTKVRSLDLGTVDIVIAELVTVEDALGDRQDNVCGDANKGYIAAESGEDDDFITATAGSGPHPFCGDQNLLRREHEPCIVTTAAAERVAGVRKPARIRLDPKAMAGDAFGSLRLHALLELGDRLIERTQVDVQGHEAREIGVADFLQLVDFLVDKPC